MGKCILGGDISIHENKVFSLDIVTLDIVILTHDNLKFLLVGTVWFLSSFGAAGATEEEIPGKPWPLLAHSVPHVLGSKMDGWMFSLAHVFP